MRGFNIHPLQSNCDVVRVQNYFILQNLSARCLLRSVESQIFHKIVKISLGV